MPYMVRRVENISAFSFFERVQSVGPLVEIKFPAKMLGYEFLPFAPDDDGLSVEQVLIASADFRGPVEEGVFTLVE